MSLKELRDESFKNPRTIKTVDGLESYPIKQSGLWKKGHLKALDDVESLFQSEIKICKKHYPKGCKWATSCYDCGVPLLLHKMKTGEILEDKHKIHLKVKSLLGED